MKQRVLITGGAGFIGSVLTAYLIDNGCEVVVVDDLSTGHSEAIDTRATFIQAGIHNKSAIVEALKGVETVIHCAAKSLVEESVSNPELYDQVNTAGTAALLEAMAEAKVFNIIFLTACKLKCINLKGSIPLSTTNWCSKNAGNKINVPGCGL